MARIARAVLLPAVLALLLAGGASAATTPAPTTPAPVTPAPAPATQAPATPAPAHLTISLGGAFAMGTQEVAVTGRALWINGVARPFVTGQFVTIRVMKGRRLVKAATVALRPSRTGTYGRFSLRFSSASAGELEVAAVHAPTPGQARAVAARKRLDVVAPIAGPGSRGTFVSLIQSRLAALHFAVPRTGIYDQLTADAVLAYRKVRGWPRIFTLDAGVVHGLLSGAGGTFQVRYPRDGRHVEADLTDQTLALINGSQVYRIYPISSGKPSTPTVLGRYSVYMKTPGYLPDGMYYSNFFVGGYAIHGYDPVPTYPASHGCLRLPIDDAIGVYNWIQLGTRVDVYYGAN